MRLFWPLFFYLRLISLLFALPDYYVLSPSMCIILLEICTCLNKMLVSFTLLLNQWFGNMYDLSLSKGVINNSNTGFPHDLEILENLEK